MRIRPLRFGLLLVVLATLARAASPGLYPEPRQVDWAAGSVSLGRGARIGCVGPGTDAPTLGLLQALVARAPAGADGFPGRFG